MWRFPVFVLRLVHMYPGDEGDWLYCRRCASSQNTCALFLAVLAVVSFAIGGGSFHHIGWLVGAGIGILLWAVAYLRWRCHTRKTK